MYIGGMGVTIDEDLPNSDLSKLLPYPEGMGSCDSMSCQSLWQLHPCIRRASYLDRSMSHPHHEGALAREGAHSRETWSVPHQGQSR
jgi:hypothetical protein